MAKKPVKPPKAKKAPKAAKPPVVRAKAHHLAAHQIDRRDDQH